MAELYIGCSGFSYKHWRGNFYPETMSQKDWFTHYGSHFSTVELNVTFYRTPQAETFKHWYEQTAPDFAFAVKGSRFITHIKRLLEPELHLDRFFEPALELKDKLKVVLWQLSPGFKLELERIDNFLAHLEQYHVRNVLEVRNESWLAPEVIELLTKRNVAFCLADWPPFLEPGPLTADFVYIRRHGYRGTYNGWYTSEELARDAQRIREYLAQGKDVFIYFNNDLGGAAPVNAQELAGMLRETISG